jgi:hypothetical protein
MNLDPSEFAHVVLSCIRLHNTTLPVANPGLSPTFCCEARRGGRDTTPRCVYPCPHFNSVRNEPKLVSSAIRASTGTYDFFGSKRQKPFLEHVLAPPEQPLVVKFWKHTFLPPWGGMALRISWNRAICSFTFSRLPLSGTHLAPQVGLQWNDGETLYGRWNPTWR